VAEGEEAVVVEAAEVEGVVAEEVVVGVEEVAKMCRERSPQQLLLRFARRTQIHRRRSPTFPLKR